MKYISQMCHLMISGACIRILTRSQGVFAAAPAIPSASFVSTLIHFTLFSVCFSDSATYADERKLECVRSRRSVRACPARRGAEGPGGAGGAHQAIRFAVAEQIKARSPAPPHHHHQHHHPAFSGAPARRSLGPPHLTYCLPS